MSSTVIKMRRASDLNLSQLGNEIIEKMDETSVVSAKVAHKEFSQMGNAQVLLLVFEKYYMRNSSMAVATVQILDSGNIQQAIVVGTGGGKGMLNFSYGANGSFAESTADVLEKVGFKRYGE